MRYIAELEHKVQTLQTETTQMSAQFTKLQVGIFCEKLIPLFLMNLIYYCTFLFYFFSCLSAEG